MLYSKWLDQDLVGRIQINVSIGKAIIAGCRVTFVANDHSLLHKVQIMAGTEPLNEDGSPPHCKAQTVKLEMEDKIVPPKKV